MVRRICLLFHGYVRICIRSGFCGRFLNLCANHGILLWDVQAVEGGCEANLSKKDFFLLRPLARKCHVRVRICRKRGLPFFVHRHRKRKIFAAGLLFCGFFIFFLSCFIWRITIEGNVSISAQTMMEYLESRDISFGTRRRAVDCRQLAADLRSAFPNITWVSVRLFGTCLSVQIRENDLEEQTLQSRADGGDGWSEEKDTGGIAAEGASDLVADADGVIVRMITREGLPQVSVGDEIRAGDVLVKGAMEITDDADSVVGYRYCAADADVYIRTKLKYKDRFPMAHREMTYTGRRRFGFYLKLFGRYFGLNLGIGGLEASDVIQSERQLCLPGGMYLPVSAGLVTAREYRTYVEFYTEEEARALAEAKLQKFLSENEEKGLQIFENDVKINVSATVCRAKGELTAERKTGRSVPILKTDFPQEGTEG